MGEKITRPAQRKNRTKSVAHSSVNALRPTNGGMALTELCTADFVRFFLCAGRVIFSPMGDALRVAKPTRW